MGRRAPDRPERRVSAELMAGLQLDGARQFVEEDIPLVARLRPAQARKGQLGSRGAPNCGSPTDEPRLSRTALGCPRRLAAATHAQEPPSDRGSTWPENHRPPDTEGSRPGAMIAARSVASARDCPEACRFQLRKGCRLVLAGRPLMRTTRSAAALRPLVVAFQVKACQLATAPFHPRS